MMSQAPAHSPRPFPSRRAADIRARLDRPVVLVGMMGAGKTRIGRLLAQALDLPFADSDEEVEKAANMSITEIFDRYGESYFRDGERRVVKRLVADGVQVIATGGGAPMNPETAALLQARAITVWLKADIELLAARATRSGRRPLLRDGDPVEILTRLAVARDPAYARAHIVVESSEEPGMVQRDRILAALDEFLEN